MNNAEIEIAQISEKLIFRIEGMCCATEADSLRQIFTPVIGKLATISFDLINGKLILEGANLPSKEQVIKIVAKTGMTATLWQDHVEKGDKVTFWEKHGPTIMSLTSLACLITGLVIHIVKMGVSAAFGGGVGGEENERPEDPPIATMVVYPISILTGGYLIFPKAIKAIRRLRPDPNFLMSLATIGAIAMNHWFEAASSMYLFSLAGIIENWNMGRARRALRKLMELAPATAQVLGVDGQVTQQAVEEIPVGTIIVIRPGEKIPMDSTLILGTTAVNQAPITGESMPVQKEIGDTLFAGTINGDGSIQCRVSKAASESTLANIIKKVEEAQSKRGTSEQWIEKFCRYYVPLVMITSVLIIIIPPLTKDNKSEMSTWYPWIYKGLQVFVISCPCSLVVSTPVAIVAALTASARSGILIKGGAYLELAAEIKAFAMDKTGTLTNGEPVVQNVVPLNDLSEEALMKLAAALEDHSDHPLARAIQRRAKIERLVYKPAEGFQVIKGKGGEGEIDGELYWIGSHRFLHEKLGQNESAALHEKILGFESAGHSIVAIGQEQTVLGFISIADSLRSESKAALQAMKKVGIKRIVMLTGDNKGAAKTIADLVGVDEFRAELLPEDKVSQVQDLVKTYKKVAMVGDGINDAPAMATASLGVAMGAAGSDAAIEAADIALMSDDLEKLAWLVEHSRNTLMIIKQNVVFSLAIKAIFTGLIFANLSTLWLSMLADIGATFIVVTNSLRLVQRKHISTKQIQAAKRSQLEKMSTAQSISSCHSFCSVQKNPDDIEAGSPAKCGGESHSHSHTGGHAKCGGGSHSHSHSKPHSHAHSDHSKCGDSKPHSHAGHSKCGDSKTHSHAEHSKCGDSKPHSHAGHSKCGDSKPHSHPHPEPQADPTPKPKTPCCSHKH